MSKLRALLPDEDFLYFGDTLNMPYGEKSKDELLNFADKIFKFFINKNAKAVIMACNTTSSVIYEDIKDKYNLKIYPIIQSVAKILAQMPIEKFGVFATPATVKSNAYKNEIQKYNNNIDVVQIACPEWVKIVEENSINKPESIDLIRKKLDEMLMLNPDKIILGCTHYPYLADVLSEFVSRDIFIDPSEYFSQYVKEDLARHNLLQRAAGKNEVFVSANPEQFKSSAERFFKLNDNPQLIVL